MTTTSAEVRIVRPADASVEDLSAFQALVLRGHEVNPLTLPKLVRRAFCLAFAQCAGDLIAVGAVKRPYATHRTEVFARAGVEADPSCFPYELGWIFVAEAGRDMGLASQIVRCLVSKLNGERSYATSRVDNARMHSSLKRYGYSPVGQPYSSQQTQQQIQLFIRECVL